jgi:hypothetical protein
MGTAVVGLCRGLEMAACLVAVPSSEVAWFWNAASFIAIFRLFLFLLV